MAAEAAGVGGAAAGAGASAGAGSGRAVSRAGLPKAQARRKPRNLNSLPADQHADELQARRKAAAEPAPTVPDGTDDPTPQPAPEPAPEPSAASSPSGGRAPIQIPDVGGGMVLGFLLYVVGLTYLRGGKADVTALLRAKFLNKTGSAA